MKAQHHMSSRCGGAGEGVVGCRLGKSLTKAALAAASSAALAASAALLAISLFADSEAALVICKQAGTLSMNATSGAQQCCVTPVHEQQFTNSSDEYSEPFKDGVPLFRRDNVWCSS